MGNGIHLLLHNIVGIVAVLTSLYVILIVFISDYRKTVNVTLMLLMAGVIVFLVSHMLGVSVADSALSRRILMWNVGVIFISMFSVHCALAALKLEREKRGMIIFSYIVGTALAVFYLIFPETFLLESVPKMYFPNYYVPGQYYWVSRAIFQLILPAYFLYEMIRVYRLTVNPIERNRIIYFAVALGLGWGLGIIPPLLIYNIQVDPLYGLFFPICFAVPFTYAILRYELLDIRIIAKKAFLYTTAVVGIGGLITLFNASNQLLGQIYPGFPFWIAPLVSAIVVVVVAVLIWGQLRQGDMMKYEFITIATHKFRTPLTHIRWAAENLLDMSLPEEGREQVSQIQNANVKLVELTNLLVNASETEGGYYGYKSEHLNLTVLVREVIRLLRPPTLEKKIRLIENLPEVIYITGDPMRLRFVIQTILENAVHYTSDAGTIRISIFRVEDKVIFSVKDGGIGLSDNELKLVFSKFYRSASAKLMDTEGMGIGLHISQTIIAHHQGKIWIESEGLGKGATVSFSLPVAK